MLFPRNRAERTFEITQVNQLLVSLEKFQGVLIASTNLFGERAIDQAALRRFDLLVTLKACLPEQLRLQLAGLAAHLFLPAPSAQEMARVSRLELTPGDFAAFRQRARLMPFDSVSALVTGLEQYHAQKNPALVRRSIGFTA